MVRRDNLIKSTYLAWTLLPLEVEGLYSNSMSVAIEQFKVSPYDVELTINLRKDEGQIQQDTQIFLHLQS